MSENSKSQDLFKGPKFGEAMMIGEMGNASKMRREWTVPILETADMAEATRGLLNTGGNTDPNVCTDENGNILPNVGNGGFCRGS